LYRVESQKEEEAQGRDLETVTVIWQKMTKIEAEKDHLTSLSNLISLLVCATVLNAF